MTKFKLAEFFSGPGGMGYGAGLSKVKDKKNIHSIEHAWASDYHQASCNTYKKNIKTKYPLLIGVAFECQKVEKIKPECWDVKLSAIVTELNEFN